MSAAAWTQTRLLATVAVRRQSREPVLQGDSLASTTQHNALEHYLTLTDLTSRETLFSPTHKNLAIKESFIF